MTEFVTFNKIARLSREIVITEKIDGTNASIYIGEDGEFLTGSRNRWITPESDNAGFARWAAEHKESLLELGVGRHFGEWWGQGIQRNYGLKEKRFSLFNVSKWSDVRPACCGVVPVLYRGIFDTQVIQDVLDDLAEHGSYAAPGFMNPEGIVIFHTASGVLFKKTIKNDETPKSLLVDVEA
jgi:hypothetical protein